MCSVTAKTSCKTQRDSKSSLYVSKTHQFQCFFLAKQTNFGDTELKFCFFYQIPYGLLFTNYQS